MLWNDYVAEALRTEALSIYAGHWQDQVPLTLFRTLHALTGLSTEAAELVASVADWKNSCDSLTEMTVSPDHINLKEELGDLWWYLALFYDAHRDRDTLGPWEVDTQTVGPQTISWQLRSSAVLNILQEIQTLVGDGFDVIKRRIFYMVDPADPKAKCEWERIDFPRLCRLVRCLHEWLDVSIESAWRSNVAKLRQRYPDKFESSLALDRNLDAEREVLEDD